VLSVLWAIGGGLWWDANTAGPVREAMNRCVELSDEPICGGLYAAQLAGIKYSTLLFALVPIPLVWLLVYIVVWATSWIRRGFQPSA